MSLLRYLRRRRVEKAQAAESIKTGRSPQRRRLTARIVLWGLPALGVIALHLFLFPPSRSVKRIQVDVGSITDQEIRAPFTFTAPRPARELDAARREAAQRVEPVYRIVDGAEQRSELRRRDLFRHLEEYAGADSLSEGERVLRLQHLHPGITTESFVYLLDASNLEPVREAVAAVMHQILAAGVVDITPRGTYQNIRILDPGGEVETTRPVSSILLGYRLQDAVRAELTPLLSEHAAVEAAVEVALYLIMPNLSYDDTETERRRVAAANSVPEVREYARNERILEAGVRVTRDHVQVLEALEAARADRAVKRDATIATRLRIGRFLILALLLGGLVHLAHRADARILTDYARYLLLIGLLALFLALSALVLRHPAWGGPVGVPIVLLTMLATVLFGDRIGARAGIEGILLVAIMPGYPPAMLVVWAVVAAATVRLVRKVRNRNQFYRAIGVISAAYLVSVFAATIGDSDGWRAVLTQVEIGILSGVASTALCLFLLPLFEALFGITTDLTLLELSDLNHPLLRRMSLESPGTYHHSQVVGSLSEAGARAVGANSLLARVGSNFHDIGKMLKPRYYVENQAADNAHDELSPSMSALVIAAHVKDGMELGRQWGLPNEVIAFIPEHHGTSVMQYFYHKALETDPSGTVKVDDFRYPGPKPRSRETAIAMLADGVEASTRSLRRPTPSRIREMTRKIFDRKMAEGELEECGLSLRDLARIREAFIPILVGIHHHRVPYPGQQEHEDRKEKERVEARSRSRRSGTSVASGT